MASINSSNFLKMRRARKIKRALTLPLFPIFSFWVAGSHRATAVREAQNVQRRGGKALINYLGEHYKDPLFVKDAKAEYHKLIAEILKRKKIQGKFNASISIKPSQFGFDVEGMSSQEKDQITFQNMREIVKHAQKSGVEVEIDMEHSLYTDFTLGTYKKLLAEFKGGLKVCLQANLNRTERDLLDLVEFAKTHGVKAGIRIVKGVYSEKQNPQAIFEERQIIENFKHLTRIAFQNSGHLDIAIGTHRMDIFEHADKLSRETGAQFEAQMLKGIALKLKQQRYKNLKNKLRVYIPYGEDAIEYGARRAKKFLKLLVYGNLHWTGKGK